MKINIFFITITILALFSCKTKPAKIEDKSSHLYTKNVNKYKKTNNSATKEEVIVVEKGETLYRISKERNVNLQDLIDANQLEEPYLISPGQVLKTKKSLKKSGENIKSTKNETKQVEKEEEKREVVLSKDNNFIWPIKGKIISDFGPKKGGLYNDGINIKAARNSPVKSCEDGIVAYSGNELKGYGNLVIIKHSKGFISAYGHLEKSLVKRGDAVKKGDSIALVGMSGNVESAQLYFGLRKGRNAINPRLHLKKP